MDNKTQTEKPAELKDFLHNNPISIAADYTHRYVFQPVLNFIDWVSAKMTSSWVGSKMEALNLEEKQK
jgi:hypothetical protein